MDCIYLFTSVERNERICNGTQCRFRIASLSRIEFRLQHSRLARNPKEHMAINEDARILILWNGKSQLELSGKEKREIWLE